MSIVFAVLNRGVRSGHKRKKPTEFCGQVVQGGFAHPVMWTLRRQSSQWCAKSFIHQNRGRSNAIMCMCDLCSAHGKKELSHCHGVAWLLLVLNH